MRLLLSLLAISFLVGPLSAQSRVRSQSSLAGSLRANARIVREQFNKRERKNAAELLADQLLTANGDDLEIGLRALFEQGHRSPEGGGSFDMRIELRRLARYVLENHQDWDACYKILTRILLSGDDSHVTAAARALADIHYVEALPDVEKAVATRSRWIRKDIFPMMLGSEPAFQRLWENHGAEVKKYNVDYFYLGGLVEACLQTQQENILAHCREKVLASTKSEIERRLNPRPPRRLSTHGVRMAETSHEAMLMKFPEE